MQLNPGDFDVLIGTMGGEDDFYLSVYNTTDNIISSNDALVKTISYYAYLADNPIDYSLFGVKVGMSVSEVDAILGKESGLYTGSDGYVSKGYVLNNCELSIVYNNDIATFIIIQAENPWSLDRGMNDILSIRNVLLNIMRKSNVVSLNTIYARGEVDTPVRIRIA